MDIEHEKACILCEKPFRGRGKRCSACLKRSVRDKYVGVKGCRICGGKANRVGAVCRRCHSATMRKVRDALSEKNPYRHLAVQAVVGSGNARYM